MTVAAAYRSLATLQIRTVYAYRAAAFAGIGITLSRILLLNVVWTAAYAGAGSVDGIALRSVLTAVTLAQLQLLVMQPTLVTYLQRRIHNGQIGVDLVRPIPFLGGLFAQQAGSNLGYLPFVILAVPFAFVLGNLTAPVSAMAALAYVISAVLAWLIATLMGLLMGLVAFWTVETLGITVIYNFATQLLGGALIPLAFFPDWLRTIATVLPFRAIAAIPVSIYMGAVTGTHILDEMAFQLLWIGLLALTGWGVWQRARRIVTVQGG